MSEKNLGGLKKKIFESLDIIRIYTKQPGRKPENRPVILKKNSVVEDLARKIHKDFVENFKFAKIWRDKSIKRVGLKYILKDNDVIEIHI